MNAQAVAGVVDPELRSLLSRQWDDAMQRSPTWATELGDHRWDDRLGDPSLDGVAAGHAARDGFLAEAKALQGRPMGASDKATLDLFVWELDSDHRADVCQFEKWSFSPSDNPISTWNYLPELHTVATAADGRALVARYRAIPASIDAVIANFRVGLAEGRVGNATSTRLAIAMVETQLADPLDSWPLLAPAMVDHPDWTEADRVAFRADLRAAVQDIVPAYGRWRDLLRDDVLPKARPDDQVGLSFLPDGAACYRAVIERHTTLPLTAADRHATGLAELDRIHARFRELGAKVFGTSDLAAIFEHLRADPSLKFGTSDEVEAKAADSLARAAAAIPDWFGRLPKTPCVVRRVPDYEAPYTTIAYYRQPHPDGTKPGEYFVNVSAPETRPRHEAEVLAFHEAIPGHHLQIAIAHELPATPAFRKNLAATAFVEGWALYSESLADEMGLYSGDVDRLGMLSFDAWRAARLVVDTGIHADGWSRAQAVAFMLENTPLAPNNVDNEVDRYINWPGQALAYKTGQIEIKRLRADAEARLGSQFDIKGFHDAVLDSGPVSLPMLDANVDAWVRSRLAP